jgi:hypothetical protein
LDVAPRTAKARAPQPRREKIKDQEPPITTLATATKATCGKGEEGSKKYIVLGVLYYALYRYI